MKKPIIGIVAKHYEKDHPKDTVIHESIKRAIFKAKGVGIGIVPACLGKEMSSKMTTEKRLTEEEKEDLIAQLEMCDGVVLQGGGFNDAYEVYVAKYCLEHNIPTLGICAGYFNMIRAVGGKYRALDKLALERHKNTTHPIQILDGPLRKIMGCDSIVVNSRHRGIAEETGKMKWAAKAEDGFCEAAYYPGQFYLAIQFHPEDLTDKAPFQAIFKALINAARKHT